MDVFQPEPGDISPSPPHPHAQMSDGVHGFPVDFDDSPTLGELAERQRNGTLTERDRMLIAQAGETMRKALTPGVMASMQRIQDTIGKIAPSTWTRLDSVFADLAWPKATTFRVPDPLPSLPVYLPPRPATGDDVWRLEGRIADLEDEVRTLRESIEEHGPETRRRIAETHLRVEQVHEYFVPPADLDSPQAQAGHDED